MKIKNNKDISMTTFQNTLTKLINDNKITFSFYNNSLLKLDAIQICYNKKNNKIELQFRNVISEYLDELKELVNQNTQS